MSDPIEEILEAKEKDLQMDAYIKKEVDKIKLQMVADLTKVFQELLQEYEKEILEQVENKIQKAITNLPNPDATPFQPYKPTEPSPIPQRYPYKPWTIGQGGRWQCKITPVVSSSVDRIVTAVNKDKRRFNNGKIG